MAGSALVVEEIEKYFPVPQTGVRAFLNPFAPLTHQFSLVQTRAAHDTIGAARRVRSPQTRAGSRIRPGDHFEGIGIIGAFIHGIDRHCNIRRHALRRKRRAIAEHEASGRNPQTVAVFQRKVSRDHGLAGGFAAEDQSGAGLAKDGCQGFGGPGGLMIDQCCHWQIKIIVGIL